MHLLALKKHFLYVQLVIQILAGQLSLNLRNILFPFDSGTELNANNATLLITSH